jgi:hypothetical protein
MQAAFSGFLRHIEKQADLSIRIPADVEQGHRFPLIGWQRLNGVYYPFHIKKPFTYKKAKI